jgi:hypothetical protein
MGRKRVFVAAAGAAIAGTVAWAGIPEPDVVLYGQVFIQQLLQGAVTDLTVIARVDGVSDPVATYRMGTESGVGDRYVLRIELESLADGSGQSNDKAVVGQTAHILIREGDGPEQPVTDYAIADRGRIEYVDLGERVPGDWTGDAQVTLSDLPPFAECLKGPVPHSGQCVAAYDFDGNSTVDLADFGGYQAALTAK